MKQFNLDYLPDNPQSAYQRWGWKGYRDFYGTEFLSFEEAREFVRGLNLPNRAAWVEYVKSGEKPDNISSNPQIVSRYKDKWKGWNDWLIGVGPWPFEKARKYARNLGFVYMEEWYKFIKTNKKPERFSFMPQSDYKDEWTSWFDFCGFKENRKKKYLPFEEVKAFVRNLGIKTIKAWKRYCELGEKPKNIPSDILRVYGDDGWKGAKNLFGIVEEEKFTFIEAREFVRELHLKNQSAWGKYLKSEKRDSRLYGSPATVYKNKGWISWEDFLGVKIKTTRNWMPYSRARKQARKLKLKNAQDWKEYWKNRRRPSDLPSNPVISYSDQWVSWEDFLGPTCIATRSKDFITYKEAREFARRLKLGSSKKWQEYCRSGQKPKNIPCNPNQCYKDKGWLGWSDFLGTGDMYNSCFLPFEEAKEFVRKLKIKGMAEWREYCKSGKKPKNIPLDPRSAYKGRGWKGVNDFLGYGLVWTNGNIDLPFEEARILARSFNFKEKDEYKVLFQPDVTPPPPVGLPLNPCKRYAGKGWNGWFDFLGIVVKRTAESSKNKKYTLRWATFKEAQAFVKGLKLKNSAEWQEYCKSGEKPKNIPASPDRIYKEEWKGMKDFLGNAFVSFPEARKFARGLELDSANEWYRYCKANGTPGNIPRSSHNYYRNKGWQGWVDFLRDPAIEIEKYLTFDDARDLVRSLNLKNQREWDNYRKSDQRPNDIPTDPGRIYRDKGWAGLKDWLGTNLVSFKEAREFARRLKFNSKKEWLQFVQTKMMPNNIPPHPENSRAYKKEWRGMRNFLGLEFVSFPEARKFARGLELDSANEWYRYCKANDIPGKIPRSPHNYYKDAGWVSWGDFLGN